MDWNIDRKISTVTIDNYSTNDAMITMLMDKLSNTSLLLGGTLFHMRCYAHILNLIVKDGLDVIRVGVEKIRESVAYWTATPKRLEKFEETVNQLLVLDPRYKMSVLEFYFEKLYGDKAEDEVDRVRQICYDLLQEYQH
ncbi:zinc finger BED domain-containing protein RICESLEEPER 2-like [Camellia sinensis]|uniref:zinc finger BED domain-containing protein RICESLEEPER 2-like n=1 Tax=Camellia sinensis TaxID=4442 RepID=UPI0010355B90|nr:zinc finger BED domain-containing protein RICESLEEPER 2-like [Camellia sinensis]